MLRRRCATRDDPAAERYLTDGRRLFRVVSQFSPRDRTRVALLEDCLTLEISSYAPDELYAMELRRVNCSFGS